MANTIPITTVENANAPGIGSSATGIVIKVSINDDAINEVIDAGYDRLILERSTNSGLTYTEITASSERPVLEKDTINYDVYDRAGDAGYYYRTRYIATTGAIQGEKSDASEAIVGAGLAISNILTVSELKARYFFGVDITDDAGAPLADDTFTHYILTAIRWFEHQLDTPILPTTFSEFHDYYRGDYDAFFFIQLDNYPVISVEQLKVQYPSGQTVIVFPAEWLRLNQPEGHLQVVPTAGTLSDILVGAGGSFLPAIYNGMAYLPQLFQVDYTGGFAAGKVPRNLVDVIGKFASLGPFDIFGDLIAGAGIANLSLSMDGLSQTVGTTCLAAETHVALADGSKPTIRELAERGGYFDVASVTQDGRQVIGRGSDARATIEAEVWEVELSNGETVRCSHHHPFRLENGTYLDAHELSQGIALTACALVSDTPISVVAAHNTGKVEQLYDLTVDEHHCFGIGQGVVVHNSSATNAGYGARIIQYTKYIKDQIPLLRRYYKGIRGVVG